jgi:tellurite resistance-related uncharacterized protein
MHFNIANYPLKLSAKYGVLCVINRKIFFLAYQSKNLVYPTKFTQINHTINTLQPQAIHIYYTFLSDLMLILSK